MLAMPGNEHSGNLPDAAETQSFHSPPLSYKKPSFSELSDSESMPACLDEHVYQIPYIFNHYNMTHRFNT